MLPTIIETPKDFSDFILLCKTQECIAVDTEFLWERTYYPILGTVQIGFSHEECYIIDVVSIKNITSFGEVLSDPSIIKILHDAQQDLTILARHTKSSPKNIFDTQKASGFAGLRASISLVNLLHHTIGINLSKTETRTNWIRRPLSNKQKEYALNDVRYLHQLRKKLISLIQINGVLPWFDKEISCYNNPDLYKNRDAKSLLNKARGIKNFSARESSILYNLLQWREVEAQRKDRPREHIIPDKVLVIIVRYMSNKFKILNPSRGLTEKMIRQYGVAINLAISKGNEKPYIAMRNKSRHPDDEALIARVDFVMAFIKGECLDNDIDPSLVGSRSDITDFIRDFDKNDPFNHKIMYSWRKDFIGEKLQKILSGKHAIWLNPKTGTPQIASKIDQ